MELSLRVNLTVSCNQLLQLAVNVGRQYFESVEAPLRDVEIAVMEPTEPGHWSGESFTHKEIDISRLNEFESTMLHPSHEWENAKDAVCAYVDAYKIHSLSIWPISNEAYLMQLCRAYVNKAGRFVYRKDVARKIIEDLLDHLDCPEPEIKGLIILEDFSAYRPFKLEPKMEIHPISQANLIELGRTDTFARPGLGGGEDIPRTDWWICEATLSNPRGTAIGFNKMHDVGELVALAFRAFKSGGLSYGFATSQIVGAFGRAGMIRGGRLNKISTGACGYTLSSAEIPRFRSFWQKFRDVMGAEQHYLQVPIRRLRSAGTRSQMEDALVDYVVGLEALLGTEEERTELGYRFRIRGSVLLARSRNDRKEYLGSLRNLYDLRSKIVHGQTVGTEELAEAMPQAESALRSVWRWYFDHYSDEPNNHKGITHIDEQLVGG